MSRRMTLAPDASAIWVRRSSALRKGSSQEGADDAAAAGVGVFGNGHVLEDLFFVPDVVTGGDYVGSEIEELFGDGGSDAEAAGGVFAVDDEEIDGVGVEDVRQVFADDMAAGGAEDVADKENIHLRNASTFDRVFRIVCKLLDANRPGCVSFLRWHKVGGFN
jgi:hypothetical protein